MKIFQKTVLIVALALFISCDKEEITTTDNLDSKALKTNKVTERTTEVFFDVYVELVDNNGNSVPASTLPGYGATNLETGVSYYDSRYEPGLFESLPIGTYRFYARDGYFDGASSAIVDVIPANETPEGWIIATLNYWSE
ncbi:hypothetical protein FIA58_008755 [Flavobacterium jejuense]|uniref:Carboxypeptidase regulatory-like domain-containing protein n=1 Tax=Flavobacterium jejuense TaxID=1544455 RepID=A0ABX0IPK4_9FLAO|nr:hypothetical protein [Flavobacterium jejuense]NHN25762.1 hypothetical protein [Flavobacterium jejuense]